MKGGVIRLSGDPTRVAEITGVLFEILSRRGNAVEVVNSYLLTQLQASSHLRVASKLAEYGVWSLIPEKTQGDIPSGTLFLDASTDPVPGHAIISSGDPEAVAKGLLKEVAQDPLFTPPIVLLGKGGSGTRVLSEAFRALGVSLGSRLNESGDSMDMMDVGYVMLHKHAENRDLPGDIPDDAAEIRVAAAEMVARSDSLFGGPWGWKLPETMIFAPLVLQAFPGAKLVHLVRHPCGVSLKKDVHLTGRWSHHLGRSVLKGVALYFGIDFSELSCAPKWVCEVLSWIYQVGRAAEWCRANVPPSQYMELRFEDLYRDPKRKLTDLASFMGVRRIPWNPSVDRERVHHWDSGSQEASTVWQAAEETAKMFGYKGP